MAGPPLAWVVVAVFWVVALEVLLVVMMLEVLPPSDVVGVFGSLMVPGLEGGLGAVKEAASAAAGETLSAAMAGATHAVAPTTAPARRACRRESSVMFPLFGPGAVVCLGVCWGCCALADVGN